MLQQEAGDFIVKLEGKKSRGLCEMKSMEKGKGEKGGGQDISIKKKTYSNLPFLLLRSILGPKNAYL